jgi:hypothetical protein
MKRLFLLVLLGFLVTTAEAVPSFAQGGTSAPSLGDLARKLRAQHAKAGQNAKVFTNDNLPVALPNEKLTVGGRMSSTFTEPMGAKTNEQQAAKPETNQGAGPSPEAESSAGPHDERYYHKQMSEMRAQLELHQRELSVLQQKLGQGQMAYYPDPNKALMQESTPAFYSDANKVREQIKDKQDQIAADEKAMEDLREQLRREGGEPGWLR